MADEPQDQQNQQQGGAESTADATGDASPAQDQQSDDLAAETDVGKLRHEAASRRRELRTVEKERDALRGRVDLLDRQEVERLVSPSLADPSDLWSGVELAELRGEDGDRDHGAQEDEPTDERRRRAEHRPSDPCRRGGAGDPRAQRDRQR